MSIFNKYHFDIDHGICVFCAEETNCYELIEKQLKMEFPEECLLLKDLLSSYEGLPINHPFWSKRAELFNQYVTKCLVFSCFEHESEKDDVRECICEKHLQEVILSRL